MHTPEGPHQAVLHWIWHDACNWSLHKHPRWAQVQPVCMPYVAFSMQNRSILPLSIVMISSVPTGKPWSCTAIPKNIVWARFLDTHSTLSCTGYCDSRCSNIAASMLRTRVVLHSLTTAAFISTVSSYASQQHDCICASYRKSNQTL